MKKAAALSLAGCLALCTPVCASETDLTGLSFSELSELRQKVEAEYRSRPEAEPFTLTE